jgi:uncharacterized protein (DUF362 family)
VNKKAGVYIGYQGKRVERTINEALEWIGWKDLITRDSYVFLKPNLTYPVPKPGVTTTPSFIEAVMRVIKTRTEHVMVGEADGGYNSWSADLAFQSHGLPALCLKHDVKLINLSKEPCEEVVVRVGKKDLPLQFPRLLLRGIDVFISLPVPKIHAITVMSGGIKNQWGCIPDGMRIVYHPYFDQMILEINELLGDQLAIADGTYFLNRKGPMDGEAVKMNLVLASNSLGALDKAICTIMRLNVNRIRYLRHAQLQGWIPDDERIAYNELPEHFMSRRFFLQRSLRNWVVCWAFDRPFAIKLFWNSWFADFLHKVLYTITGNPVKTAVTKFRGEEI